MTIENCISREAIKRKLQERHDFFIHAYNGFSNMPQNDKSRVDEINNCIAMVVNEPPVTPKEKTGKWINDWEMGMSECSICGETYLWEDYKGTENFHFCPNCGAKMVSE